MNTLASSTVCLAVDIARWAEVMAVPKSHAANEGSERHLRRPLTSGRRLQISITQPAPGAQVEVEAGLTPVEGWAPESSVALEAVADWIAECIVAPFEQLREQWPANDGGLPGRLVESAEDLDSANQELHGVLVKDSVGFVAHAMAGGPPWFAAMLEAVARHLKLPHDDLIDTTVQSLRLASVAIGLVAGPGVPVVALLELINDALKEKLTDAIKAALTGPPSIKAGRDNADDEIDDQPPSITAGGATDLPELSTAHRQQRRGLKRG